MERKTVSTYSLIFAFILFLALLKLATVPAETQIELRPICLPDNSSLHTHTFEGDDCYVTGWGSASLESKLMENLQELKVPILQNKLCSEPYDIPEYGHVKVRDSHLCAGSIDGLSGTCVVSTSTTYDISTSIWIKFISMSD